MTQAAQNQNQEFGPFHNNQGRCDCQRTPSPKQGIVLGTVDQDTENKNLLPRSRTTLELGINQECVIS